MLRLIDAPPYDCKCSLTDGIRGAGHERNANGRPAIVRHTSRQPARTPAGKPDVRSTTFMLFPLPTIFRCTIPLQRECFTHHQRRATKNRAIARPAHLSQHSTRPAKIMTSHSRRHTVIMPSFINHVFKHASRIRVGKHPKFTEIHCNSLSCMYGLWVSMMGPVCVRCACSNPYCAPSCHAWASSRSNSDCRSTGMVRRGNPMRGSRPARRGRSGSSNGSDSFPQPRKSRRCG